MAPSTLLSVLNSSSSPVLTADLRRLCRAASCRASLGRPGTAPSVPG